MKYSHAMARRKRQPSQAPLQHPLATETSAQTPQASVPTRAGSGSWSFAQMPVQRQAPTTDISASSSAGRASRQGNQTGLPNQLKVGIEHLSGQSLDDVRVHYNSSKPAQLNALAYTQGTEIYMGPRQERHLGHEAWHVVQQKQGRVRSTMQMKGVAINDEKSLEHEADMMGTRALQVSGSVQHQRGENGLSGVGKPSGKGMIQATQLRSGEGEGKVVQRAIGLEIEIPVPIDQLTPANVIEINNRVQQANTPGISEQDQVHLKLEALGIIDSNGRVPYRQIRARSQGFRVDSDHDSRVQTPDPYNAGWPPPEGGKDSIIEIVMDPPAQNATEFRATMVNIHHFINQIYASTGGLTTRWINAFGDVSVGPMDYTALGIPNNHRPYYNFEGSIQVNIGIDPREYNSLLGWYANSNYARPTNAPANEQAVYQQINEDIQQAIAVGNIIINDIRREMPLPEQAGAGNLRGLLGWVTYLAFYLKRGTITRGVLGGTTKNVAPVLLKSPPLFFTEYGMTPTEIDYFTKNRRDIINDILRRVGRNSDAKGLSNMYRSFSKVDAFKAVPGAITLKELASLRSERVVLTGKPLRNPTGVGLRRTGNAAVQNLPNVPVAAGNIGGGANTRGGVVLEFRTIPGYYNGVASWQALGLAFFNAAQERNNRNGIAE